jgi:hypothetical protein
MSSVTNLIDDISGKRCSTDWSLLLQNTLPTSSPEFTTGRFADNHFRYCVDLMLLPHDAIVRQQEPADHWRKAYPYYFSAQTQQIIQKMNNLLCFFIRINAILKLIFIFV